MFNPEKRADLLRQKMMKNNKYLIAKIEGSGQEKDSKKVIESFFRWKEYIGHHTPEELEWLSDSLENVWSPKYMGLSENFFFKPIEEVKKLEFQNPAYSAAYAFKKKKGDPREYRKVFAVQVSGCTYSCNYCYVPPQVNAADAKFGKFFSPKEIIDFFLKERKESNEPMNVLRITGGEPTIIPEIIIDINNELEKRNLDNVYFWNDTNLSTPKYLEKLEDDLKPILQKRNVGVVGCFKGVSKQDFFKITGADPKFYENQFETTKLFLDWKTDFYVYLPALVYENDINNKTKDFLEKLKQLNKNLPLRVEMLIIKEYPGALINMQEKAKEGRPMPKTDQRVIFDLWYNKLLPKYYSKEMLNKFCCEISL
ncbi:MAG: radical SAM protein [Candidatus Aenigmatarchaeota archaeon]